MELNLSDEKKKELTRSIKNYTTLVINADGIRSLLLSNTRIARKILETNSRQLLQLQASFAYYKDCVEELNRWEELDDLFI